MSKEQLNNGRSFDDVGITDNIMFSTVFQENSELCRNLLESILGFEIEKLKLINPNFITMTDKNIFRSVS